MPRATPASTWRHCSSTTEARHRRRLDRLLVVQMSSAHARPCVRTFRVGGACGPPPPVVAPLASSLRTPSRGDPPLRGSGVGGQPPGTGANEEAHYALVPARPPVRGRGVRWLPPGPSELAGRSSHKAPALNALKVSSKGEAQPRAWPASSPSAHPWRPGPSGRRTPFGARGGRLAARAVGHWCAAMPIAQAEAPPPRSPVRKPRTRAERVTPVASRCPPHPRRARDAGRIAPPTAPTPERATPVDRAAHHTRA